MSLELSSVLDLDSLTKHTHYAGTLLFFCCLCSHLISINHFEKIVS